MTHKVPTASGAVEFFHVTRQFFRYFWVVSFGKAIPLSQYPEKHETEAGSKKKILFFIIELWADIK